MYVVVFSWRRGNLIGIHIIILMCLYVCLFVRPFKSLTTELISILSRVLERPYLEKNLSENNFGKEAPIDYPEPKAEMRLLAAVQVRSKTSLLEVRAKRVEIKLPKEGFSSFYSLFKSRW